MTSELSPSRMFKRDFRSLCNKASKEYNKRVHVGKLNFKKFQNLMKSEMIFEFLKTI